MRPSHTVPPAGPVRTRTKPDGSPFATGVADEAAGTNAAASRRARRPRTWIETNTEAGRCCGSVKRPLSPSLAAIEDPHREARQWLPAAGRNEPRVLHVEAVATVLCDRVRMHREHHVLAQLRLDPFADLRMLDHRHADRVARHVPEVVAALAKPVRDGAVDIVRGGARFQCRLRRI